MKFLYVFATLLGLTSTATAQEFVTGWSITFANEPFSGETAVVATAQAKKNSIESFSAYVYCVDGAAKLGWSPAGFFMSDSVSVSFKIGDNIEQVSFSIKKLPVIGNRLVQSSGNLSPEQLLESGKSLSFKSGDDTGTFPMVGYSEVLEIMQGFCKP